MNIPTSLEVSKMLDHSLLNPTFTATNLIEGCLLAKECKAASAMVLPYFTSLAADLLAGSGVLPSTTVGFPHGSNATSTKEAEAILALKHGAQELDMVVNISKVRSHDWDFVASDIMVIHDLTHAHNAKLKVIFENAYLSDDEKIKLCEICTSLGVDWVKTSTGYAPGGATEADVILMRKHTPPNIQIKAAGGVRTLDGVLRMRELGCSRIGASATKAIMDEYRARFERAA
jgi:deoxyribose-phosphate aldolase